MLFRSTQRFPALVRVFSSNMSSGKPSSDMAAFRKKLRSSQYVVVLTGAGISAESGIPTFRGAGGYWRTYEAPTLASPIAFKKDPSLVWEFYHHRREVVLSKEPNDAHKAVAECEKRFTDASKEFHVITQNIDDLHHRAGTKNLLQLHGSLFKVRCTQCGSVKENKDSPICEALRDKGAPDPKAMSASIPEDQLPRCVDCGALARPHVVWFGENLDAEVLSETHRHLLNCDLCLLIGTSSVVYPAANFAPMVSRRGVPVAEFNLEETPATGEFGFHFQGKASELVPQALAE